MPGFLVLWDVDYTLVNAAGVGRHLYELAFADLYGGRLPFAAAEANMAGRTDRAIALDVLELAGVPDPAAQVAVFEAALARLAPRLAGLAAAKSAALPGAAAAISALAGAGIHSAGAVLAGAPAGPPGPFDVAMAARHPLVLQSLLTGNVRALAEVKLAGLAMTAYLDLDIGAYGDESAVRAELVYLARARAEAAYGTVFAGEATVLIGDTPLDVAAALAAGARAIGVATGSFTVSELAESGAHAVLPDLTDTGRVLGAVLETDRR